VTLGDCHTGRRASDPPDRLRRAGKHNHSEHEMTINSLKDGTIVMADGSGTAQGAEKNAGGKR
jgi:hypothetical protein